MGRWGESFFEGDSDLDEASYMSQDAGIELYHYGLDPEDSEYKFGGKGLEATRKHLNSGIFEKLFEKYATEASKSWIFGKELKLVLFAALGMRVGATISPKHMAVLRSSYIKIRVSPKYSLPIFDSGFRGPMKEQFEIARAHYKNDGTPYNFDDWRCGFKECSKDDSELEEGKKLKKCAKCLDVMYCSKECQTAHWKVHKKICKTPEERRKAEKGRNRGRAFISMNV